LTFHSHFCSKTGLLTEGDIDFFGRRVTDFNINVYFGGK